MPHFSILLLMLLSTINIAAQESETPKFIKATKVEQIKDGAEVILVAENVSYSAGIIHTETFLNADPINIKEDGIYIEEETNTFELMYATGKRTLKFKNTSSYLYFNDNNKFSKSDNKSESRKWVLTEKNGGVIIGANKSEIIASSKKDKYRFQITIITDNHDYAYIYVRESDIEPNSNPNPDPDPNPNPNPDPDPDPTNSFSIGDNVENNIDIINQYNGQTADITLYRSFMNDGGWYTLCLPFDLTEEDLYQTLHASEVRTLSSIYEQATSTVLYFHPVNSLKAGTPCIIRVKENFSSPVFKDKTISATRPETIAVSSNSSQTYQFTGTFSPQSFAEFENIDNIRFLSGNEVNSLKKPASTGVLPPFRGYFVLPDDMWDVVIGSEEGGSGLTTMSSQDEEWTMVDLLGRQSNATARINNGRTGVWIVRGRKVTARCR